MDLFAIDAQHCAAFCFELWDKLSATCLLLSSQWHLNHYSKEQKRPKSVFWGNGLKSGACNQLRQREKKSVSQAYYWPEGDCCYEGPPSSLLMDKIDICLPASSHLPCQQCKLSKNPHLCQVTPGHTSAHDSDYRWSGELCTLGMGGSVNTREWARAVSVRRHWSRENPLTRVAHRGHAGPVSSGVDGRDCHLVLCVWPQVFQDDAVLLAGHKHLHLKE